MTAPSLRPGDILLYAGKGLLPFAIKLKTWSHISHVEIYIGNATTWTSRSTGTNFYPFTSDHLEVVMRPLPECQGDLIAGIAWAKQFCGRPYDTWGLLRFFRLGRYTTEKMFCSEAVVSFARASGCHLFHADLEPDQISPGDFLKSPHLETVWARAAEDLAA